ncbi:hypothetical protein GWA97_12050 [Flavobacterium sp. LaA7.5]|nr:hypothetical protein [Flavobacterium salilacus subsp. altitudinum]
MKIIKIILVAILLSSIFTGVLYYFAGFSSNDAFFVGVFTIVLSYIVPEVRNIIRERKAKALQ